MFVCGKSYVITLLTYYAEKKHSPLNLYLPKRLKGGLMNHAMLELVCVPFLCRVREGRTRVANLQNTFWPRN